MTDSSKFRANLKKLMPGYDWTVHKATKGAAKILATGTQSSGFNRISTLQVTCSSTDKGEWYTARSAGFGKRAPWLHQNGDVTLARALRGLQDYYRNQASLYDAHARALGKARAAA